jgi:large subunit ribosomal protein L10
MDDRIQEETMPRPEKVQAVADIKERFERATAVFLAEYAGLSVSDQQTLRRSLRENGAEFKVVKMTLARRATADLEIEVLDDALIGPTGIAFAEGDPVGAAKVLRDFAKEHEVFTLKGGLLDADFLTPERVSELADIEPREELLAKIAGLFNGAMAGMAGVLNALPREMVGLIDALIEKKREAGEPEGEAAVAEAGETAASEAASDEPADADDAEAGEGATDDATAAAADDADAADVADDAEPEAAAETADDAEDEDTGDSADADVPDVEAAADAAEETDDDADSGDDTDDAAADEDAEPAEKAEEE